MKLTIELDADLSGSLLQLAKDRGWRPEDLVVDCVRQQVEATLRHRVLIERMEIVDAQIEAIARFIEQASAGGGGGDIDLFKLCRYPRKKT